MNPQSDIEGGTLSQEHANRLYSFKDEHVVSLFKLLQKSNKLKLSEDRCLKDAGKIDDPTYCLYHKMLGHPTKNCYIFKDVLQALINAGDNRAVHETICEKIERALLC